MPPQVLNVYYVPAPILGTVDWWILLPETEVHTVSEP